MRGALVRPAGSLVRPACSGSDELASTQKPVNFYATARRRVSSQLRTAGAQRLVVSQRSLLPGACSGHTGRRFCAATTALLASALRSLAVVGFARDGSCVFGVKACLRATSLPVLRVKPEHFTSGCTGAHSSSCVAPLATLLRVRRRNALLRTHCCELQQRGAPNRSSLLHIATPIANHGRLRASLPHS